MFPYYDDPIIDPAVLRAANAAFDAQHPGWSDYQLRIRAGWNTQHLARRGYLTDKKINKYSKQGYYDPEFKAARRTHMNKKSIRKGAFVERDGRLVYSPK